MNTLIATSGETITARARWLARNNGYPSGAVLGRITASGKYALSPATGADGSQTAVAVLLYPVNATLADAVGIIVTRGPAIVSRAALAYEATVNDAAKIAAKITQLAAAGIVARDGV